MTAIYPIALAGNCTAINCGAINAIPLERTKGEQARFALGLRSGIWE